MDHEPMPQKPIEQTHSDDLPRVSRADAVVRRLKKITERAKPWIQRGWAEVQRAFARTKAWHDGLPDLKRGRLQGAALTAMVVVICVAAQSRPNMVPQDFQSMIEQSQKAAAEWTKKNSTTASPKSFAPVPVKTAVAPKELEPRQEFNPADVVPWSGEPQYVGGPPLQGESFSFTYGALSFDADGDTIIAGRSVLRWGPRGLFLEGVLTITDDKFDITRDWTNDMMCRVSGDTALISAPRLRNGSGAVFVFERTGGLWKQTARLVAPDARPESHFGACVDIDADWIVVGSPMQPYVAPGGSDASAERRVGAAYAFRRTKNEWAFAEKITVRSLEGWGQQVGDWVAVSQGRIAVRWQQGGEGSIVLGHLDEKNTWVHEYHLTERIHGISRAGAFALDKGLLAVPAVRRCEDTGRYRGADQVYVFQHEPVGWRRTAAIVAPDYHELDNKLEGFGWMPFLRGQMLTVHKPGKIYAFSRAESGKWSPAEIHLASAGKTPIAALPIREDVVAMCVAAGRELQISASFKSETSKPLNTTTAMARVHESLLEKKADGLAYQLGQSAPFTGLVYELSPTHGRPLLLEEYAAGKLHGTSQTFDPEGRPIRTATYASGELKEEKIVQRKPEPAPATHQMPGSSVSDILRNAGRSDFQQQINRIERERQQAQQNAEMYQRKAAEEAQDAVRRMQRDLRQQNAGRNGALGIGR